MHLPGLPYTFLYDMHTARPAHLHEVDHLAVVDAAHAQQQLPAEAERQGGALGA